MLNYKIAIPTKGRSKILQEKTLATLELNQIEKNNIYIFVTEDEYEEYKGEINGDYNIIVGVDGLVNQRNFIENYFNTGEHIVFLDDDISEIDLTMMPQFQTLNEFFCSAFEECIDKNSFIWSVYPVYNPFFRKKQTTVTYHLNYCVGAFYGIINRPNHEKLQINKYLKGDEKEDVLRTLLFFINDGIVLRYNQIGFKTKYYGNIGGMGKKQDRLIAGQEACEILQDNFSDYGKVTVRKNGVSEFKLKKTKVFNPDRSVTVLPKIDDKLIDELYSELQKITVKKLGNNIRLNFSKQDRSILFGQSKGRFTGIVTAKSANTKKFPHIFRLISNIGQKLNIEFSSVFLNHNVTCKPHKDKNNVGKSCLLSFGEYTGSNIIIDEKEYDANRQPVLFNGALLEHYNTPDLEGNKYSLVFFTGNY